MNRLVSLFVTLIFSFTKLSCAEPESVAAAHSVALGALRDAATVEIKGAASVEDTKPAVPLHVVVKDQKTIAKLRNFLVSAHFAATDRIHPQKAPGGSEEVLYFIVTTKHGQKITFALIQGDDLVIPNLRESESADPNFIFPLGRLLLEIQQSKKAVR